MPSTRVISSSAVGSSMVGGSVQEAPSAIFLIVPRRIFPERVFGNLETDAAVLKKATGPMRSRTRRTSSAHSSLSSRATPALSTTKPTGTSPLSASSTPTTAHSATSLCEARISSMAPVESRWPAMLMTSSMRPMIER